MNPHPVWAPLLHVAASIFAGLFATVAMHAQGSLTPPGPPAPTMKTLDQVEARTIVNATNTPGDATNTFIITTPGSYYLTGNITGASGKHGINILANDVTLDLNGFALISGGGATRGVNTTTPLTGLCIRNGSVRGWAGGGICADFAVTRAEKLSLTDNIDGTGLTVGNGSMVTECVASGNATGFFCPDRTQISNCIATVNTGLGFDCTSYVMIIDCTASRNFGAAGINVQSSCSVIRCSSTRNLPGGSGIVALDGCAIESCTVGNNGGNGISVSTGCTVADCAIGFNGGNGILAGNDTTLAGANTIRDCTVRGNLMNGIHCIGFDCHVVGNTCDSNARGILSLRGRIEGNSCSSNTEYGMHAAGLVVRNSAHGNGVNFSHVGQSGVVVEISGGGPLPTSSWANIIY